MFLTKISLDVQDIKKHDLQNAYAIHRFVYSLFAPAVKKGRFLYAERLSNSGKCILVLSEDIPSLIPDDIQTTSTEVTDDFLSQNAYRFEVIINPVRRDSKTRKREAILGQLPLLQWFSEHSKQWGFEPVMETLEARTLPSVCFPKGSAQCRLHRVLFRGILKVTTPDIFKLTFKSGIGHSKAFGFGLLQLVPINM